MKHIMRLNNGPFESIKSGTKTIELRLNDEKRKRIKKENGRVNSSVSYFIIPFINK